VTTSVLWFRRDLRLGDHPALLAARDAADEVLPLFVLDDALRDPAGKPRLAFLYRCLQDLYERTDGKLRVVHGDPVTAVPRIADQVGATSVHISSDHGPYGRRRDDAVAEGLGDIPLEALGSPYGITPGTLTKSDGTAYKVYTPFFNAWTERGVHSPAPTPRSIPWTDGDVKGGAIPDPPQVDADLPEAGERAALQRWRQFRDDDLDDYADTRNRPDLDRTSHVSVYLKWGNLHPRTVLADLTGSKGAQAYRREIVFRDFYADVLWNQPRTARHEVQDQMRKLHYDTGKTADERFDAWAYGTTGFPIVDAAMRQLLAVGWMHNRMRMVVASFLTKDLHVHWRRGSLWFMQHLVDGDLASNQHGWQWTAGTGTDPSPYFRVFNPIKQGQDYDPDGTYIRRWVPELREARGKAVHTPWTLDQRPTGYPAPIVDHAEERKVALERYADVR
jgi:deoxyribodipyrimidine photo-lyase